MPAAEKKVFAKTTTHNSDVASVISDAFEKITGLGEEFREIYDNAPENLQGNDVNSQRDETASAVESLSEPSVDSSILGGLDVSYVEDNGKVYRGAQRQSRACQAGNAATMFRAAAEAIDEWMDSNREADISEDSEGKWRITIDDVGSDSAFDTEDDARAAFVDQTGHDIDDYKAARDEGEQLSSDLNEIADEIEGMEWPGMFG